MELVRVHRLLALPVKCTELAADVGLESFNELPEMLKHARVSRFFADGGQLRGLGSGGDCRADRPPSPKLAAALAAIMPVHFAAPPTVAIPIPRDPRSQREVIP